MRLSHNLIFIPILFSLVACNGQSDDGSYDMMLKGMYKNTVPLVKPDSLKEKAPYVLLDTREKEEYDVSHLMNAKWVGYDTFKESSVEDIPKDTTVILYCAIGYRSERIGEQLQKMGFKNVYNLYGGIFEWVNEGNTVVNNQGQKTNSVHAYSKAWGVWLKKGTKVY